MKADHFWLCLFLDAVGKPCNRRTMKPLSMCSLHRRQKTDVRWPKTDRNSAVTEDAS